MLRILKSNPIILLALSVLTAIGIWVFIFTSRQQDYTINMPFFNFFLGWAAKIQAISVVLGAALLLLCAFTWNAIINNNSLLKQSSYFPAFFFVLLASCRATLIGLYPALFATLFLMLAVRRIASSYKKEKALSDVFDAGLFIGIASLFYFPAAVFIVYLWIAILIIRSLAWREWAAAIIGFSLPFAFAFAYHYVFLTPEAFWYGKILSPFGHYRTSFVFTWHEWLLILTVVPLCAISFWLFINKLSDNILKTQKIWNLMLWFVFFALISVVVSPHRDAQSLVILVPPCSFIFSNYFIKAKSAIWPELLFICLLVMIGLNILS